MGACRLEIWKRQCDWNKWIMNHWGYGSVKMLQLQPPAKQEVIRVSLPLIDPSKRQQEDIWVTPPLAINVKDVYTQEQSSWLYLHLQISGVIILCCVCSRSGENHGLN